ncbi:PEGA domain-containing protein [Pyxidicoccus fallax]|uniref:non-specific serine/threonine protein kinase n=1 Tax=Pyxidicoccus fallax TaxID=394095 RepID=A0A848L630_9BACT|nr:serine/threonine-protein kinase [Pyxidicoccus fallax]NMO14066.1 PEGA domain-containing protein [Pyxidicoccus fallax]NPC78126.1 PEGA domain-containing protein [Pyxidicoccus fallax]
MSSVRYQSLSPLGAGEGSRAFLGLALEDGAPPRPVVLIWAPQEIVQNPEMTAKLTRETARALVFEHPNILRVHGLAAQDGGLARVTEFADGEPLRRLLEVHPRLPPQFAALVIADAAMGLHYAHMAGNDDGTPLVHGDVRPETLMISFGGVTKVTGYGALGVAPRERDGKRVKNRRKYSAPEQLLGGREAVNVQSDVFLLGLVLHEALSGKMPFKETADPDKAVLNRSLPPLPQDVPLKIDAVVRKATTKRAYDRYTSALAFREALVEAVGTLPTHAQFAEFIAKAFPPESEARASRRRIIEAGIADVLQKAGVSPPIVAEFLARGVLPAGALPAKWPELAGQLAVSGPVNMGGGMVVEVPSANVAPTTGSHAQVAPAAAAQGPASGSHAQVPAAASQGPASGSHAQVAASAQGPASGSHAQVPAASSQGPVTGSHAQVPASAQGPASGSHAQVPAASQGPASGSHAQVPAVASQGLASEPAATQSPAAGAPAPIPVPPSAQKPSRAWVGLVVAGLVLTLGAAAVVLKRLPSNIEAEVDAGDPLAAVTPSDALADAGTDAGIQFVKADTGILDLTVEPRVEASVPGTYLGRTPLSATLPAGKHVLTLSNPVLGIQVTRNITVPVGGRTAQQIFLNKGFATVRAPEGAIVTIDGRLVGAAPVEELDLYEGTHQLLVVVNNARWTRTFKIEPGQRVNFDVEFEQPPEAE